MIDGHGDDIYSYDHPIVSNFSSNVFYGADLSGLKTHLCNRLSVIGNYPEPEPRTLEKELAAIHQIPAETVCVTNGATEAIYLIAQTFQGSRTTIHIPAFSEYADACRIHGHKVTSIHNIENIPVDTDMVWICNPNNPTGTVIDKDYLKDIILLHPQKIFVIDMAYEAFTRKETFSPEEALGFPNVILLHSMTKLYAIPGLRLGYITAPQPLVDRIRSRRMPWAVNSLAIEAGLYIVKNKIHFSIQVTDYLRECDRLKEKLEAINTIQVCPTDTHFMLARLLTGNAGELKDYLVSNYGFLIRDASNFEGLGKEFFRIAGQTPEENSKLIEYIKEWISLS